MPPQESEGFVGFHYYGRKRKLCKSYAAPKYGRIVEPFCGAAAYACAYPHCEVTLADKNEVIVETWKYLIGATRSDILTLPIIQHGESLSDERFDGLPAGARYFIGFNLGRGATSRSKPSPFNAWNERYRKRVAETIHLIDHWKVSLGDYTDAQKNVRSTWFVDPPYSGVAGKRYTHNNTHIDYSSLAEWVQTRKGLVIACENVGATWLPFVPLPRAAHSTIHWSSKEANVEAVFTLDRPTEVEGG